MYIHVIIYVCTCCIRTYINIHTYICNYIYTYIHTLILVMSFFPCTAEAKYNTHRATTTKNHHNNNNNDDRKYDV